MKKVLITGVFSLAFSLVAISTQAQSIEDLKLQKEVVDIHSDILAKKMTLEKEREANVKLKSSVEDLNKQSNRYTDKYASSSPNDTAKDAKKTSRVLRKTESANKDLDRSNSKIIGYEADIKKLENKLDRLKYTIEIKDK